MNKRKTVFPVNRFLVAAILIGAALRFYQLGAQGMWIDEGYSLRDATVQGTVAEASKPLYYGILGIWMAFTPDSVAWFRVPAAIFGVVCIWLTFLVGRRLTSETVAAFAAFAAALSPLYIDHSQEVRMYTLLLMLVLAQMYFFLLALDKPNSKRLAMYGLFTLLAVLTHSVAAFIILPQALFVAIGNRLNWRSYLPWFATGGIVLLLWSPVLVSVFRFRGYFSEAWIALEPKPGLVSFAHLVGEFMIGAWDIKMVSESKITALYLLYTLVVIAIAALAVWCGRRDRGAIFTAAWLTIPVAAIVLFSHLGTNFWVPRYMIFVSPALFLLLGMAVVRMKRPWLAAILTVIILTLPATRAARYHIKPERPQWPEVAAHLAAHAGPNDQIGIYRSGNRFVFQYYYDGSAEWRSLGPEHFYASQFIDHTPDRAAEVIAELPHGQRYWLIIASVPIGVEADFQHVLKDRYRLVRHIAFRDVNLYEFSDLPKDGNAKQE